MSQTGLQNVSTLLQGQGPAPGLLGASQATENNGNVDFLATLQTLLQPGLEQAEAVNPSQMLADLKALLDQQMATSGNAVPPTAALDGSVEDVDINELIKRLQAFLDNSAGAAALSSSANASANPADIIAQLPLVGGLALGGEASQLLADRRRLAERFNALTNAKAAANRELSEVLDNRLVSGQATAEQINKDNPGLDWMRQLYSSQVKSAQEYSEGGQFREQANLLAESRNILSALTAGDKALVSNGLAEGADATFNLAAISQQAKPVTSATAGDVRPMQSFIPTSLQDPQWQTDFSQRVSLIARNGNQFAEIRLNPANLGPIEVRVVMTDDQATITFSSQNGAVREAIEASLPRLREMFSSSGLQLADAQVSDQALPDQQQQRHERENASGGFGSFQGENSVVGGQDDFEATIDLSHIQTASDLRGIDLFA